MRTKLVTVTFARNSHALHDFLVLDDSFPGLLQQNSSEISPILLKAKSFRREIQSTAGHIAITGPSAIGKTLLAGCFVRDTHPSSHYIDLGVLCFRQWDVNSNFILRWGKVEGVNFTRVVIDNAHLANHNALCNFTEEAIDLNIQLIFIARQISILPASIQKIVNHTIAIESL